MVKSLNNKVYIFIVVFLVFCCFSINYLAFHQIVADTPRNIQRSTKLNTLPQIKFQQINDDKIASAIKISRNGYLYHRDSDTVDKNTILNRNCTHIDAVYTWVNGSDPHFIKKRSEAGFDVHSDLERYRDLGTLKYSLRGIELFAPWIKNIWILTDSQIPDYINLDIPSKIKFIYHESFFANRSHLPTFSSVSIESNFYNLPEEVSNCFLYFNDDVLLKEPVEPSDFFDDEYNQVLFEVNDPVGMYMYKHFNELDAYHKSLVLSSQLLDSIWKDYGKNRMKSDHGVQVFDRKVLLRMHQEIGDQLCMASSHKKRDNHDPQLAFIYNQYVKRYAQQYRAKTGFNFYGGLVEGLAHTKQMFSDALSHPTAKVMCLNDGLNNHHTEYTQVLEQVKSILDAQYPISPPWETQS